MDNNSQFLSQLKTVLPENTWSWVIAALRQDRLIWSSLLETNLGELALKQISSNATDWSPASLALLACDLPKDIDLSSVDEQIRIQANQEYERTINSDQNTPLECESLRTAGLLAIALWEKCQISSWTNLIENLHPNIVNLWKTPLACLFGMVVDPVIIINILINPKSQEFHRELGIHTLLSNPISTTEQVKILRDILSELPLSDSTRILKIVEQKKPNLAVEVSRLLIHGRNKKTYPGIIDHSLPMNNTQVDILAQLLDSANINTIGSLPSRAGSLHAQALQMTQQIQDNILMQLVDDAVQGGDIDLALATWQRGLKNRQIIGTQGSLLPKPASLLNSLIKKERFSEALEIFKQDNATSSKRVDPYFLLVSAWQAYSDKDFLQACTLCRELLTFILDKANKDSQLTSNIEIINPLPTGKHLLESLGQLCLVLDMPKEGQQALQMAVDKLPNDVTLLASLAEAQRTMGDAPGAAMTSHLLVGLTPNDPIARYRLIDNLEAAGDWNSAFKEREDYLDKRFSTDTDSTWPKISDLYFLANCSIRAGHPQRAEEICLEVIQNNPEDGMAYAILGEALNDLGDIKTAIQHFQRGTELAPDLPEPWLAYARAMQSHSETEKSLDILKAATLAVKDNPIIYLSLAEAYHHQNDLTQTLKYLREANTLVDKIEKSPGRNELNGRISLMLGQTLHSLGYLPEARQVLETSYSMRPAFPGLAYRYAKVLLAMNESRQAIPALVSAIRETPDNPELMLDYAQAQIDCSGQASCPINSTEIVRLVERALGLIPDRNTLQLANAKALLAESLAIDGQLKESLLAYYRALETELVNDPAWHGRLSYGLGRVAIQLSQFETAIAALQEASRFDPENPKVYRALAETFASINLPKEALNSARTALQYANTNKDIINWFADIATKLGEFDETIAVLSNAIDHDPTNISYLSRLAIIQTMLGKSESVQATINQIITIPDPDPDGLYHTAQSLLEYGNVPATIACLERALEVCSDPDIKFQYLLARAYRQANKPELALHALEQAIQKDPGDHTGYIIKADLLLDIQSNLDALHTLETANQQIPNDPLILYNLALLYRTQGKFLEALTFGDQILNLLNKQDNKELNQELFWLVHLLTAELCRSTLDNYGAQTNLVAAGHYRSSLRQSRESDKFNISDNVPETIHTNELPSDVRYGCLSAELALENEQADQAAKYVDEAINYSQASGKEMIPARILAIQAQLAQRRGDVQNANQILTNANLNLVQSSQSKSSNALAVAIAAADMHNWQVSLDLLGWLVTNIQVEPFTHLQLARILVLRAEYQLLCQELNVITHAPGAEALSEQSYQTIMESLGLAGRYLPTTMPENLELTHPMMLRWQLRAQAVFQTTLESIQRLKYLSDTPQDLAARIAALYRYNDMSSINNLYAEIQGRQYETNPHLQVNLALAFGFKGSRTGDLELAIGFLQEIIKNYPEFALPYYLLARLTERKNGSADAIQAMQSALSIWSDEPRWHAYIANLYAGVNKTAKAGAHLSKAIELEPGFGEHYLALGEVYLQLDSIPQAIRLLSQAQRIMPDQVEPYLALARAHIKMNDLPKAALFAERAIALTPDQINPLLIRAKIALAAEDPRGALSRAQSALQIAPNDTTALHTASIALAKLDRKNDALDLLNKGIPLATNPIPLEVERVKLLEELQGKPAALAALQVLINQYSEEATILAPLAFALADCGQREAAIRTAQNAFQVGSISTLGFEQTASLHQLLGKLLQQSGQLDQAIYEYTETIRLIPNSLELYLELGNLYQTRRQQALAMQTYQKAIMIASNDPRPYYQAGMALKESHDYKAAENMLRRAATLAKDDINIHRSLAAVVALNLVYKTQSESVTQSTIL